MPLLPQPPEYLGLWDRTNKPSFNFFKRHRSSGDVAQLAECFPNIPEALAQCPAHLLCQRSKEVQVKGSEFQGQSQPRDGQAGMRETLPNNNKIHTIIEKK